MKKALIISGNLVQDHEFIYPYYRLLEEGYNLDTGKTLVKINKTFFRPAEVDFLLGDSKKANTVLGWYPSITCDEMISEMVQRDFETEKNK